MAKRLSEAERKTEIMNACDLLYQEKGFRDITIQDISKKTSFSRPSIYNYFETKEEIFLGLLTREYKQWTLDLRRICDSKEVLSKEDIIIQIAKSLQKRKTLLKITVMNLYEIEDHSRLERLMAFKMTFKASMEAFKGCVVRCASTIDETKLEQIQYIFFPFMYGIYPYVYPTQKQQIAMDKAGVAYRPQTIQTLVETILKQII